MKHNAIIIALLLLSSACIPAACQSVPNRPATFPCPMKSVIVEVGENVSLTYNVADIIDSAHVYRPEAVKENCFFVASKQEFRLYVYEVVGDDTLLAAHYPICYGRNAGAKSKSGDCKTPECTMESPFTITKIADASWWTHDFGDGRGEIASYGAWFLGLETGFKGIGIHGSTNNEASVPGMDSEGCIRLRDADIIDLATRYALVGTKVVIKSAEQGKLPFEIVAQKRCRSYQNAFSATE